LSKNVPGTVFVQHGLRCGIAWATVVSLEMATVASRVVAEIYEGIDFPSGWADTPDDINLGMARNLLVSVAAMLDGDLKPIALCWRVDGREERFMHAQPTDPGDSSLLDELNRDLETASFRFGATDLLATMLWAPDELRPDQGQPVEMITFAKGRASAITGWNVATRTLVAKASGLLFMTHRVDQDLSFPGPASVEEMHQQIGSSDPRTLIVLAGPVAIVPEKNIGRKMVLLGMILLGAIITMTYLINPS
jgi:hypothetical protein